MREISLAILDVALNSVDAGATDVEIAVVWTESGLSFTVTDNGEGMDESTLKKAAERGVSFKGSSGLGLALVKEDAESCGGELKIISQKGNGTTVEASFCGSPKDIPLGNLGATYVALIDDGYEVMLRINAFGTTKEYYSRELKSSFGIAALQASGTLRLIREDINKFIRQNGGAML